MAQKERSKEVWLIPKRVSLHQTICLIDGILDRKYDGTSWSDQKQNNLGVNLKKWGATKDGKNISSQSIRTLVASIPQYLGFLYINTDTTPNTICLTDAGKKLWENHVDELEHIPNLVEGRDFLITESKDVLRQMEKLQITNPIIQKDCENIYVFPFRFMLKILLKIGYLDKEEIAYFLFKVRDEDEEDVIVQEINNFRSISKSARKSLIDAFKETHIGNITLVKAASSGYYMSLCQITGIIDKLDVSPNNLDGSISAIKIKSEYKEYVEDILNNKYENAEIYKFDNDLKLWIAYIGNPNRDFPPISVSLFNTTKQDYLIQIIKNNECLYDDLLVADEKQIYPMFVNEDYSVKIIDISTGLELSEVNIIPDFSNREFDICSNVNDGRNVNKLETLDDIIDNINEHCDAQNFSGSMLNYLKTLAKVSGVDKTSDKALRGAYYEYLYYKLLLKLKESKVIDDVVWNGKVGKYGLPVSAPGGKTGTPDMSFIIDDKHFVLELTTIKPKALQFSAEGSSVPDHIRLYRDMTKSNVTGVFCAPEIHERNKAAMSSTLSAYGIVLKCIRNKEFLELLKTNNKEAILEYLTKK